MTNTLTARELEIARLVGIDGLTSKAVARALGLSWRTVEAHRSHIFNKLGVRNVVGLARMLARFEHMPPRNAVEWRSMQRAGY